MQASVIQGSVHQPAQPMMGQVVQGSVMPVQGSVVHGTVQQPVQPMMGQVVQGSVMPVQGSVVQGSVPQAKPLGEPSFQRLSLSNEMDTNQAPMFTR